MTTGAGRIVGWQRARRRTTRVVHAVGRAVRRLPGAWPRWRELPVTERRRTWHAFAVLLLVEATFRWVRIPTLARWLGVRVDDGAGDGRPVTEPNAALRQRRRAALRATRRVIDRWPFGTGPCLRESLVLGHLLRADEPVLRFGVARRGNDLAAHAWVEIDGRPVNDPQGVIPLRSLPG